MDTAAAKPTPKKSSWLPMIIIAVCLIIALLHEAGYIDFNFGTNSSIVNRSMVPGTCPTTSNPPCHSMHDGVSTEGVVVHAECDCPPDTNYSGTTDVVTPGGPWKICNCR